MKSPASLTIAISAAPAAAAIYVRLSGEVDMVGELDLDRLERHLAELPEHYRAHIDLAGVTFAGSTLVNFLFRLCARRPAAVSLCRPTPMTLLLIRITGLDKIATVRDRLPRRWPTRPTEADACHGTRKIAVGR